MIATHRSLWLPAIAVLAGIAACSVDEVTRPQVQQPAYASGSTPTVTSTDPADGKQGQTIDVQVLGTGFDQGSHADFLLNGLATAKVKTNSTRYVSATVVVANVTIAIDAITDAYDVAVTTSKGRKGIGTELFTVHTIADLGTLGGATSKARSVNSFGIITGAADRLDGHTRAVVWSEASGIVDIGTSPGDTYGSAWGVNDAGVVVGISSTNSAGGTPAVWTPNGSGGYDVHSFGLIQPDYTYDVNNSGTLVGDRHDAQGNNIPYMWTQASGIVDLPLAASFNRGRATAISNGGTIVGWNASSIYVPTVWPVTGGVVRLPLPAGYPEGQALGVNDLDIVVGEANTLSKSGVAQPIAVRWRPDPARPGTWLAPDILSTLTSVAYDINNAGQVVGKGGNVNQKSTGPVSHGFLWQESTGMQDLGALTKQDNSEALHINDPADGGQPVIVGKSGNHAVRWRLP
jgi:probable HAF family extracellular repeat protein